MTKMRVRAGFLCLLLLFVAFRAEAVMADTLMELTATFLGFDTTQEPPLILLSVNGKELSGPLDGLVIFFAEREKQIKQDEFLKRYLNRAVTVEISEGTGRVLKCRVGS